ncbi:MAG: hypothetical protein KC418_03325 [Anaerolineales bacterium]|nr:hypothetical protein [Anaerolineales bacterium]MCB8951735.1 hypothetical protein [Ardenticatenales bacterium]
MDHDHNDDTLAQTDNFIVWRSQEDGDTFYHVELGGITLHFLGDEWDEFIVLMREASASKRPANKR